MGGRGERAGADPHHGGRRGGRHPGFRRHGARADPARRRPRDRESGGPPAPANDGRRKAGAGPAVARLPRHRQRGTEGARQRPEPDRCRGDQQAAADRRRAVPAAHPDLVRVRHDPRLPHDLPDPARRGQFIRPQCRADGSVVRRAGVGRGRPQADVRPDGGRLSRAAMGPDLRGGRRGPVPELGLRRGPGARRAGQRLQRPRQDHRQPEALRRVRPAGGWPRLQHNRHVRAAAAQLLPAAVQGRDRRRCRHGDVLVQRDQRRARLRELLHRDRHPQEGVGLRRVHRE